MPTFNSELYKSIRRRWNGLSASNGMTIHGVCVGGTLDRDEYLEIDALWYPDRERNVMFEGYARYIDDKVYGEVYIQDSAWQFRYKGFVLDILDREEMKRKLSLLQEALDV